MLLWTFHFLSSSPCSLHKRHRQCSWKGFQGNVSKTSIPPKLWGSRDRFSCSQRLQGTRQIAVPIQKLVRPWRPWDPKMLHGFFMIFLTKKQETQGYLLPLGNFQSGRYWHILVTFLNVCQLYEMYPKHVHNQHALDSKCENEKSKNPAWRYTFVIKFFLVLRNSGGPNYHPCFPTKIQLLNHLAEGIGEVLVYILVLNSSRDPDLSILFCWTSHFFQAKWTFF